jgi:hypothetical protein
MVEITGEVVEIDGKQVEVTKIKWAGYAEEYTGVTKIIIDGGSGNDSFLVDKGVTAELVFSGAAGDDLLFTEGTGLARFDGGDGNQLAGSLQSDFLYGGAGNDIIDGGETEKASAVTTILSAVQERYHQRPFRQEVVYGGDGDFNHFRHRQRHHLRSSGDDIVKSDVGMTAEAGDGTT